MAFYSAFLFYCFEYDRGPEQMWKEGSVSAWLPPACAPRMGAALTSTIFLLPAFRGKQNPMDKVFVQLLHGSDFCMTGE